MRKRNFCFLIIQKQLLIDKGIPQFKVAWSRIDDYSEYLNYQKLVRQQYKNQIPNGCPEAMLIIKD